MAKEVIRLSIRDYAKSLGISDTAVRKAITKGKIKKGVAYVPKMQAGKEIEVPEIIKEIADKEWGVTHKVDKVKPGQKKVEKIIAAKPENQVQTPKISSQFEGANLPDDVELTEEDEKLISSIAITSDLGYSEVLRRREIFGLILDKYKVQEVEGKMVKKEIIDKALYRLGVELKKSLMNMPARIAGDVLSATNVVEVERIMITELTNILNHYSNLETFKI